MKRRNLLFSICLCLCLCLCLGSVQSIAKSHSGVEKPFRAKVMKIIDGDSLKARVGEKNYELRLYGIDAPEYDQPFAGKAKKFVKKLVLGKNIKVIPVEYDRYGRLVAIVSIEDSTVNEKLLDAGLAWYYPKYCKKKLCSSWQKVSNDAQKQKINIWSSSASVPPWKWKYNKLKRNYSHGS